MGRRARRTVAGAGAFLNGFLKGQEMARGIRKDQQDEEVRGQIAATDENFTPRQTPAASGEEAMAAGQQAHQDALKNATSEEEIAAVDANYKPTLDALQSQRNTPASVVHSMGTGGAYKQQDEPFSPGDVEGAKARERASIYSRAGREDDAARVLLNASRSRELSDQDAIRGAYATPAGTAAQGIPMVSTNRASTGLSESMDASMLPAGAQEQMQGRQAQPGGTKPAANSPDPLPHYLERIAPRVQAEYVRQGKLTEAKAFQDLMDSQEGRNYTKNWASAVRRIETGDFDGAVPDLAKLYTSYPDGRRAQAKNMGGGKFQIDMIDEATGKIVQTATLESGELVRKAVMALRPEKLAEFMAAQEGKRTSEAASLDKSLQLEGLRQEGQETREDRRDARLVKQIDAANARHAQGRGLTAAQERSNAEIDAARDAVAGMSPQDIARRTAKATNTGRENPDFDPGLARQAALAGRRKVGDDELFDAPKPKPAAPAFDRADVAKRFRADRTMDRRTLGKETPNGIEVLEKGKLIGYFQ
jgi:hypothetical protein